MPGDVAGAIGAALSLALGQPVRELRELESDVQREALIALPGRLGEPVCFSAGSQRYVACRYHHQRQAALILGPFRNEDDHDSDLAPLDGPGRDRAIAALRQAARGLQQATDASAERIELASRLEVASRATLAISSELALDTVLNRIVDLAREISGAQYAALGVPGPSGTIDTFLTVGISNEDAAAIAHRPVGRGLLGQLLREPGTIRLADLATHAASAGFPPNHPPMRSFLGVPIVAHGQVLGNLYLTEKLTGSEFTDDDARLVEELARHAAVAIENARLYQQVGQQQQRLQLILDQLPEATLLAERDPERITLANQHASNLLGWQIETPIPLATFLDQNPRHTADGARMPADMVPMVQSLRTGERISRREVRIERADGQMMTVLVNSTPLSQPDGQISGAIAVFQDITQIKDADQLKDDFLSLVSHELRTPLTTIQGGALLLQRDWPALDDETRQEVLTDIAAESRRLGALIENMVQLANIRAGRMRMETEPVHVRRLIEAAIAATCQLDPERVLILADGPDVFAEADPDRLDQVVRNLLSNAIKYAPAGLPVEVTTSEQRGSVTITVRDHGPGIAEADLPGVFDRFSRAGRVVASGAPGMGLGLYLARHVVEAHGGSIRIESPADGGTRVVLTLPAG